MIPRSSLVAARLLAGLVAASVALAPRGTVSEARAERPADEARALQLFHDGEVAYREGRFEQCVELLREARRLKKAPVLLYDLARAYEALGDLEQAASSYEAYLAEEPRVADRKGIQARVERLRLRARAAREGEPPLAPESDPEAGAPLAPPPPDGPRTEPMPGRVVVAASAAGLGVVALGAGVFFGLRSNGGARDAEGEPVHRRATELVSDARDDAGRANVALVAGAALVGIGALAWFLWPSRFVTPEGANARSPLRMTF